jgi:predicted nucleotidyltransferase component of viral defense system
MLRILPLVNAEKVFAIKGGTAINFFVRDLPRISVDIDLAYLPVNDRDAALKDISKALKRISAKIERMYPGIRIVQKRFEDSDSLKGMVINKDGITVKIEPNLVFRGSVYKPEIRQLSKNAQNLFELTLEICTLAKAELYGGKICAALDRQHPRDLFDINLLFKNESLSDPIRKAFIVYLISHQRPMVELINPRFSDIRDLYDNEFKGMSIEEIGYDELIGTRERLVQLLLNSLEAEEKQFIVSVKTGKPNWGLFDIEGVDKLPAVKWKLLNISRMDKTKHERALNKLKHYLGV